MENVQEQTGVTTPLSVEDYIQLELRSERRHEFVNGQLIEMPGKKPSTTELQATFMYCFLRSLHQKVIRFITMM